MGFTGIALGSMLHRDGIVRADTETAWTPPTGKPLFPPKAKSVIWIFLSGGYSHLETFDPKFKKYGQVGVEITDWWPHLAGCVDDIAFVRSMYTTDNDHAAENQMHTGRHKLDEVQPSIGSWVHYGLGSLNENLPQFIVVGGPTRADTVPSIGSYYLGPKHAGVPLALDPNNPLPYGKRSPDMLAEEQRNEYELIGRLNSLAAVEYPEDAALRARIKSYELAFRMQTAVPEALRLPEETAETQRLYGIDEDGTRLAGQRLVAARRLVERGVRFVQVYPTPYGLWDSHRQLQKNHAKLCAAVDKPVEGLLKDLKQRGLWNDVVVVFCTEFGRTPGLEQRAGGTDGRDHHPHGFTIWLAGAGIKRGIVHGATDELGFHAIEPGHYVTDIHATVLHLLGLDSRKLEIPGRKRLEMDFGRPIHEILT
jgi:hypothetical protein